MEGLQRCCSHRSGDSIAHAIEKTPGMCVTCVADIKDSTQSIAPRPRVARDRGSNPGNLSVQQCRLIFLQSGQGQPVQSSGKLKIQKRKSHKLGTKTQTAPEPRCRQPVPSSRKLRIQKGNRTNSEPRCRQHPCGVRICSSTPTATTSPHTAPTQSAPRSCANPHASRPPMAALMARLSGSQASQSFCKSSYTHACLWARGTGAHRSLEEPKYRKL